MNNKLRYICGLILANILILFGFVRRAKIKIFEREIILSIYFHKPTAKEFEKCIKWLIKNNFSFLSTSDLYNLIQQKSPFPKGSVLITVDDGWESNEDNIVAIANKYGVPVTIFIATDPVESGTFWWSYVIEAKRNKLTNLSLETLKKIPNEKRLNIINNFKTGITLPREALSVDQIKKIANSSFITIGGHTLSHPILINCTFKQVCDELQISKQKIEGWLDKKVEYFAFPNGAYSYRDIKILYNLEYKLAFTTKPNYIVPETLNHRFEIPRFGIIEDVSFAETICRMIGIWEPFLVRIKNLIQKNK